MKARLLFFCLLLLGASRAWGDGEILFVNRFLMLPGGGTYHVPIWIDMNHDGVRDDSEGIGTYAAALGQTATLALYVKNTTMPIATALFRAGTNGAFLGAPPFQSAVVPGYDAGQNAPLTIKAWVGPSYESALVRAAWDVLSPPLGGTPEGGFPIIPPTVEGWGDTNGFGFVLNAPAGPIAGNDIMTRPSLSDGRISIATLLANDSDPNGAAVAFVRVDPVSNAGASITVDDGEIVYHAAAPKLDYFFYTIQNGAGIARGRVDVLINDPDGMIVFANRHIPAVTGDFFYDVPIFVDADSDGVARRGELIGEFAATYYNQPARLGLFLKGSDVPLATASFRTDENAGFLGAPASQIVTVPGAPPGAQVDFTIKAWIGADYASSRVKGWWDFTSAPLGGGVVSGALFPIPGLTGWRDQFSATGLAVSPGAHPLATADVINRPYRQDATVTIETLLANDTDQDGPVTFVQVDPRSSASGTVTMNGSTITYKSALEADDYFYYTIRGLRGATARGRVDIKVGEPPGEISFGNIGIRKASGEGTYDVPIWVDYNTNGTFDLDEGIGDFARHVFKPAYLGLYMPGSSNALAIAQFGLGQTDSLATIPTNADVLIPGSKPGDRVPLTVKVWVGDDFETASLKKSWDFTSMPLGGPRLNDTAVPTPGLTGWGDENGQGFGLAGEKPAPFSNVVHIQIGQWIPISILLTNGFSPGGGTIYFYDTDPVTQGGMPIFLVDGGIYLANNTTGVDAFSFRVLSASGGLTTAQAEVTIDPCQNCGATTGGGTTTGGDPGPVGAVGPAKLHLSNRLVRHSNAPGAYNIPIWVDANFNGRRDTGEGIGAFASRQFGQNATLALFVRGSAAPLATARFHTDSAGAYLDEPEIREVTIPNAVPNQQIPLTIKVWVGDDFASATLKGSWDLDSKPLGGQVGAQLLDIPDLTGWGDENNSAGFAIVPGVKPRAYGQVLTRQPGQNVSARIADMTKNDSDPQGGPLTFVTVDTTSKQGGLLTVLSDTVYYVAPVQDTDTPDYFEYTVRNSRGGTAKGRVDVVVTDANGRFQTRPAIENAPDGNHITFRGLIGTNYLVQYRDSVDVAWQDLAPASHEAFGLYKLTDPAGSPVRLYRVLTQ
jgi:hypothetical protein